MRVWLQALLLCGGMACGVNVEPPYVFDALKVAAVVAEPPDVAIGMASALRAYIISPNDPNGPVEVEWSYCIEHSPSSTDSSCADAVALPADDPVQIAGAVLSSAATFVAQPSLLTGVPEPLLDAGFWVQINLTVQSPHGRTARAFKRVVVSSGKYPRNVNPLLHQVDIWDAGIIRPAPFTVHVPDAIELVPNYAVDNFQQYEVLTSDGQWLSQNESAQFTWYVSHGALSQWQTSGDATVLWALPSDSVSHLEQTVTVLRDGRGGTSVYVADVRVEP